jgi:penicillin-binding protein 1C
MTNRILPGQKSTPTPRRRRLLFAAAGLAVILAGGAVGLAIWLGLWPGPGLPDPATISQNLNTPSLRFTDRNGRLLYEDLPETGGRHTTVELAEIPAVLRQATIATEDANFYQNPGVDLAGILRAAWIDLRGGEALAGGSTITQQVARRLLLGADEASQTSLRRKLREAILAWNVARVLPKDQVLALYLNQMYYGNLAYGVEAASQTYFGRPARELDLAQAALLAGIPQLPARYDPFQHPEAAKARQVVVLGLMEKTGAISGTQRALAQAEPLVYNPTPYPIRAPHFVMMVRAQIDALTAQGLLSPAEIYRRGGLTVRTTLDLDWQGHAEDAIAHQLDRLRQAGAQSIDYQVSDAALVALDPANGEILCMVGSADYFDETISGAINMAISPRQPGSALKPLIYAAAFDPTQPGAWTPATMLLDVSTNFTTHDGKAYTPANYDELEHGPVLARQALASSLNIPAVLTLQHVGLQRLFSFAGQLGITTLGDPDRYDLSVALGGGDVSLLELSAAYGALANHGDRVTPRAILDIRDPQGRVVYAPPPAPGQQVIDPRVAWQISDVLSDDAARELGFGLNSVLKIDRPAAVKTGTTTNFHDNWTVGYTPGLVVGVWAGNADQTAMRGVNGLTGAAPIWHEFIRTVLAGKPVQSFERPPGLVQTEVCALSGLLPTPDCPYRRLEWFIDGTQPTRPDTFYRTVTLDSQTGLLATAATPPERRTQRAALDLPAQAIPWGRASGQLLYADVLAVSTSKGYAQETGVSGPHLLSPPDHAIYHLSPGLDADTQRILIQIAETSGIAGVTLWVDDRQVASFSKGPYEYWWALATGKHVIRAEGVGRDGQAWSASVEVEVK